MTTPSGTELAVATEAWQPFASFVVEYQSRIVDGQVQARRTKAHHIETDACATWPDLEEERLCQWITQVIQSLLSD